MLVYYLDVTYYYYLVIRKLITMPTMFVIRTRQEVCSEFGTSSPQMIWRIRTTCPGLLLGATDSPSDSLLLPSRLSITLQTHVSVIYLQTTGAFLKFICLICSSTYFRIILPYYFLLYFEGNPLNLFIYVSIMCYF